MEIVYLVLDCFMRKIQIDRSQIVQQFGLKISSLSHRMIKDNNLAIEAAQEVWYEVLKSIESFNGYSDISTWIFTIAKRTILRYAISERIYSENEINNHFELDPIDYDGTEEDKKQWVKEKCDYCLTAFCHCLNNDARLIFLFRDVAGLSYSKISEIMELGEENVRKVSSRSKEKVKKFMDNNCTLYNQNGECKCRIRKHVLAVDLDKEYNKLANAASMVSFFLKFDKDLPRKNYWEKYITEDVTN